jgi:hypothetical protein
MSGRNLLRLLIPGLLWMWLLPNSTRVRFIKGRILLTILQAVVVLGLLFVAIDHFGNYSPFLYFQF